MLSDEGFDGRVGGWFVAIDEAVEFVCGLDEGTEEDAWALVATRWSFGQ